LFIISAPNLQNYSPVNFRAKSVFTETWEIVTAHTRRHFRLAQILSLSALCLHVHFRPMWNILQVVERHGHLCKVEMPISGYSWFVAELAAVADTNYIF